MRDTQRDTVAALQNGTGLARQSVIDSVANEVTKDFNFTSLSPRLFLAPLVAGHDQLRVRWPLRCLNPRL